VEDDQHVAIEEVPEILTATEKEELCGHLQNFQSDIFSQQDMLSEYLYAKCYVSNHS